MRFPSPYSFSGIDRHGGRKRGVIPHPSPTSSLKSSCRKLSKIRWYFDDSPRDRSRAHIWSGVLPCIHSTKQSTHQHYFLSVLSSLDEDIFSFFKILAKIANILATLYQRTRAENVGNLIEWCVVGIKRKNPKIAEYLTI